MAAEQNLPKLALRLPPPFAAPGMFQPLVISGGFAYVAGHGPMLADGKIIIGRVGDDLDAEGGRSQRGRRGSRSFRRCAQELGDLERVQRPVKSLVMVNCTPDFKLHPQAADGFSRLFADIFGPERGVGARSAVGLSSLPFGIAVEVEAVLELH